MGQPSSPASNALIYVTYALFLVLGLVIAWRIRNQSKAGWLSANGSQRGQISIVPSPSSPLFISCTILDGMLTSLVP